MPQLIIKRGKVQIDRFPLSQDITTVGRTGATKEPPDLELLDSTRRVSRYHAAFVRDTDGRFWIVDLFSANSTEVNGNMVYRKRLNNGDIIQIGDFRLIYDETERTEVGLPLLVLVDGDQTSESGLTGDTTVVREHPTDDSARLTDHAQTVYNDIVTRLKHLGKSGAVVTELIMLLVSSLRADCGFVATMLDEKVLVPLAAHGFGPKDSARFQVSQECVQVALNEGRSVLRSVQTGLVLCCPLVDSNGNTGVLYLHTRNTDGFEDTSASLLDLIRVWIEERDLPILSRAEDNDATGVVSGRINWPTNVVTANRKMRELVATIDKIAEGDASVLLVGDTGTGKEVLAERIHRMSRRSKGPWLPVDLTSVDSQHIEGLLFGWKKGAFTTAYEDRPGDFVTADGGTLFLDEIGDTSLGVQAKLRRAVEEKEIRPLGGVKPIKVDTRVLAATNKDIYEAVENSKFRQDLLMRFTSIQKIPPLRDRLQDLPLLLNYFIDIMDGPLEAISRGAMRYLYKYSWPGNVREVRTMVYDWNDKGKEIVISSDIPEKVIKEVGQFETETERSRSAKRDEKSDIIRVLRKTQGNVERATRLLGFGGKQTLYNKLKAYGLKADDFRPRKSSRAR